MQICCKLIAFALAAITLSAARGGVPTEWQVRIGPKATVYQAERYHGDALDLRATLTSGGLPLVYQGAARLYAQTNGMGARWWNLADVTVASNVLAATWRPEFDTGADVVDVFLGAPSNFQAHARIRFLPSPGPAPNSLPMPTPVLDFAAVDLVNVAALTNGWSFGSSADLTDATNYTDQVAAEFEDGTRTAGYANDADYAGMAETAQYLGDGPVDQHAMSRSDLIVASTNAAVAVADAKISTNNPAFVSAVLAAPLAGASASDIAEIAEYGGYGTVGAALLALIAGLAALKRRVGAAETAVAGKADAFKLTSPVYDEHGDAQLVDGAVNNIVLESVERLSDDWGFESGEEYLRGLNYNVQYDSSEGLLEVDIDDDSGDPYTNEVSITGDEIVTATVPLGRGDGGSPFFRTVMPIDVQEADMEGITVTFGSIVGDYELFSITVSGQDYLADGQTFDWGGVTFTLHTDENITADESTWEGDIMVSGNAWAVLRRITRPMQNYQALSIPPPVSGRSRHFVVRIDASMTEPEMLQFDLRGATVDGDEITMPDAGAYVVMRFTETSANVLTVERVYPRPSGGGRNPVYYGGDIDEGPQRTSDVVGTYSSDIDLNAYEGSITITGGLGSSGYTGTLVGDGGGYYDANDMNVFGDAYDPPEGVVLIENYDEGWSYYVYIG